MYTGNKQDHHHPVFPPAALTLTHVFAYQESFETPKKRRKLENSAEISVCENASASSVAGSTTSCSLPTLKSATIEECLAKKKRHR